jgi:hypothetical protein
VLHDRLSLVHPLLHPKVSYVNVARALLLPNCVERKLWSCSRDVAQLAERLVLLEDMPSRLRSLWLGKVRIKSSQENEE